MSQTVVMVREDTPGDSRLVAYYIARPGSDVDTTELRNHVRDRLPYYMVPHHFVAMEQMPQTNNGKIDFKALPVPSQPNMEKTEVEPTLPSTPAEKFMLDTWKTILDSEDVGLNDNFFEVGGHSLLVMKVITAVNDKTNVRLSPQDFLVGTLEQVADRIADAPAFDDEIDSGESNPSEPVAGANVEPNDDPTKSSALKQVFSKTLKGFWD